MIGIIAKDPRRGSLSGEGSRRGSSGATASRLRGSTTSPTCWRRRRIASRRPSAPRSPGWRRSPASCGATAISPSTAPRTHPLELLLRVRRRAGARASAGRDGAGPLRRAGGVALVDFESRRSATGSRPRARRNDRRWSEVPADPLVHLVEADDAHERRLGGLDVGGASARGRSARYSIQPLESTRINAGPSSRAAPSGARPSRAPARHARPLGDEVEGSPLADHGDRGARLQAQRLASRIGHDELVLAGEPHGHGFVRTAHSRTARLAGSTPAASASLQELERPFRPG